MLNQKGRFKISTPITLNQKKIESPNDVLKITTNTK